MTESVWPSVEVDGDLERARQQWLHTNGAGAYAASTVATLHTRRYDGLLVAALDPPRARHVILSHVDATLRLPRAGGGVTDWPLAVHQFPGVDPRESPCHLGRFDQDPLPRFRYAVGGGELEITLALLRGKNAVVLRYLWSGPSACLLVLRPLLALRPLHHLTHENGAMVQRVEVRMGEVRVRPRPDLPRVCFAHEGTFLGSPDWWRRFEYLTEAARGLDFQEDLWTPGVFEIPLAPDASRHLVVAVDELPAVRADSAMEEAARALSACDPGPTADPLARRLHLAADAFRADLAARPGVLAGYPWFEVWGRDTLISLPGLYLVPGRIAAARRVLSSLVASMRHGLVPNRVPEAGEAPEFHTADATLWLFEAARLVAERTGVDDPFVTQELVPALREAFEASLAGTLHGIHVTREGLFAAGGPGTALTWMDARVDGVPVTPRSGCPVELQALWSRGCDTLSWLADALGDARLAARAAGAAQRARAAFRERFWCEETGYPYDVVAAPDGVGGPGRDPKVRPNAVVALALDPGLFTSAQAEALLDRARADLVTPAGLRTLAPWDPAYVGHYGGGVAERDGAYHQGTVWPFLLGFYVRAAVHAWPEDEHVRALLRKLVRSAAHNALALGQVPEIASGDPPHRPDGCYAQAWSVAELLRAWVWDLAGERAPREAGHRFAPPETAEGR